LSEIKVGGHVELAFGPSLEARIGKGGDPMKTGYVLLWRRSRQSPIFAHDGMWKLFSLCLMNAAWEPREVVVDRKLEPVRLEPGQLVSGRQALWEQYHQIDRRGGKPQKQLKPSPTTLYRWLLTMQRMQILHIEPFNKYSIITIVNWLRYQFDGQQANNRRTSGEHKEKDTKKNKEQRRVFLNDCLEEVLSND
jgi:hypothetical protein